MNRSTGSGDAILYVSADQTVPASRTRNVTVGGARSSIRLEEAFWDALDEILRRENLRLNDLVSRIWDHLPAKGNLSGAVRVFVHSYFHALSQNTTPKLPPERSWQAPDLHN
ncbi:ribbon-helix-helix domain-containing protein [Inquilinus sp. Marseille-Q2685]|uniref:ribbon-helix-helix domain-containing protein n=1 Tax=Inquilinus sp. Marseille-Q2685 TaxID=2866581 RepID=UPI001CE41478|nr:ribbon-helix-helix domain-containing protein [Inquilinus sp. Marseille-Q2685]